jgi:hypothetical protein
MIRRRVSLLLATLIVCAPAAGGMTSGLKGTLTVGPLRPVCSVDQPCDGPAANATLAFSRNGRTTRARTDAHGVYRVTLAPGWYAVRTSVGIAHVPRPARARVLAGRYRVVNFFADTGIR